MEPISFYELLQDSVGVRFFKQFLQDEFSAENIFFWLDVEDFKRVMLIFFFLSPLLFYWTKSLSLLFPHWIYFNLKFRFVAKFFWVKIFLPSSLFLCSSSSSSSSSPFFYRSLNLSIFNFGQGKSTINSSVRVLDNRFFFPLINNKT